MGKKKEEEISLDDLEEELIEEKEETGEEVVDEEEEIEEIEEFSLDEVAEKEEIEELFAEEEGIEREEEIEEIPKEEEIIDERIYIVPLYKARHGPRTKWAKKSVRYLRKFMTRHFKPEALIISQDVNEKIWSRGISKPPRKIKIRATKNLDGLVVCYLA
ncbi:MAG: 60S ribosomal protein L31 [Candidatus Lokiarchaeota archaeon]|nr:60S ribosomal protein L31 [Candidatus Lokiarchaeota archaeon]